MKTMADTIYASFAGVAAACGHRTALMCRKGAEYAGITYAELRRDADAVAAALHARGIAKGDRVAIFSANRPEWAMTDLAALKLGAIVVPLYQNLPAHSLTPMLRETAARLVFVDTAERAALIESIRPDLPNLEAIVLFGGAARSPEGAIVPFEALRTTRERLPDAASPAAADDVATIVYTSGTSGEPKGVMLTHRNILSNVRAAIERFRAGPDDLFLSFLPLCHMFERTTGYYALLLAGGTIAYARNLGTIAADARAVRPTLLIAVPRFLERAYAEAEAKLEAGPRLQRAMVLAAIRDLNEYANRAYRGQRVSLWLRLKCALHRRLVAPKFHQVAGGRLRAIVVGGAPLDRQIAKLLHILGFRVVEGYGMTEASPVIASNLLDDDVLGTVGKPLDGVEVRVGDNDEILVRGPNVMRGYWQRPDDTARAIDPDGWLHTGDQGRFDERGHLVITGRIKELIVTSYGKKVAPAPIEAAIAKSPFIEHVMLHGDRRDHLVALVVPDQEAIERHAAQHALGAHDYPSLLGRAEVRDLIQREVAQATAELPRHEKPKTFALVPEPFTLDNGLLTPTLKLRRHRVAARYAAQLEELYERKERQR